MTESSRIPSTESTESMFVSACNCFQTLLLSFFPICRRSNCHSIVLFRSVDEYLDHIRMIGTPFRSHHDFRTGNRIRSVGIIADHTSADQRVLPRPDKTEERKFWLFSAFG